MGQLMIERVAHFPLILILLRIYFYQTCIHIYRGIGFELAIALYPRYYAFFEDFFIFLPDAFFILHPLHAILWQVLHFMDDDFMRVFFIFIFPPLMSFIL